MSNFLKYARYYDLLYADKNYVAEADYIAGLIHDLDRDAVTVLDLGCGTGVHASLLAQRGFRVHGVDKSEEMLATAQERGGKGNPTYTHGDARSLRLDLTFDIVISLFHVMSYQTTNDDILQLFKTASRHLLPGGCFIFDCWYGPAVLSDRPVVRVKRCEDQQLMVTRIAEPVLRPNENLVEIEYQLMARDKSSELLDEFQERHLMRYLFKPEIELLASQADFSLENCFEFMTGKSLGFTTWNACFVVRKNE